LGVRYEYLTTSSHVESGMDSMKLENELQRASLLGGMTWRKASFSWGASFTYGFYHDSLFKYHFNNAKEFEGRAKSAVSYSLAMEGNYFLSKYFLGLELGVSNIESRNFRNSTDQDPASALANLDFKKIDFLGPYLKLHVGAFF